MTFHIDSRFVRFIRFFNLQSFNLQSYESIRPFVNSIIEKIRKNRFGSQFTGLYPPERWLSSEVELTLILFRNNKIKPRKLYRQFSFQSIFSRKNQFGNQFMQGLKKPFQIPTSDGFGDIWNRRILALQQISPLSSIYSL